MALVAGSKYLNTTVPVAGTPVITVAQTGVPMPVSNEANQVMVAKSGIITVLLSGAATSNTYRTFVLPANHIVVDLAVDVVTGTGGAGAATFGVLGQACASVDGGTALTIDAAAANSAFTGAISLIVGAGLRIRSILSPPQVLTNGVTKNASVGVAVSYDRVIGFTTTTAVTTADAVIEVLMYYVAV
jgi:hypothetical protein